MLEGLDFPADKPKIFTYVKEKLSEQNQDSEIVQWLENNLTDNKQFNNVYELEVQAAVITQEK
jgi:CYTH domain-containing protein